MEESELQEILERDKWMESERVGHDVCGEFPYCTRCDKTDVPPCPAASFRHYAKQRKRHPAKRR